MVCSGVSRDRINTAAAICNRCFCLVAGTDIRRYNVACENSVTLERSHLHTKSQHVVISTRQIVTTQYVKCTQQIATFPLYSLTSSSLYVKRGKVSVRNNVVR